MMSNELYKTVKESLENAKENGYSFKDWSDEDVALDMCRYNSDLEEVDINELIKVIKSVRGE